MTEIAHHYGLKHYGGVGSAVHVVKQESKKDKKLLGELNSIIKKFAP